MPAILVVLVYACLPPLSTVPYACTSSSRLLCLALSDSLRPSGAASHTVPLMHLPPVTPFLRSLSTLLPPFPYSPSAQPFGMLIRSKCTSPAGLRRTSSPPLASPIAVPAASALSHSIPINVHLAFPSSPSAVRISAPASAMLCDVSAHPFTRTVRTPPFRLRATNTVRPQRPTPFLRRLDV